MAKSKSILCQGVTYSSVLEVAERFGIHPSTVARRLRDGWTPEAAVGAQAKPKRQGHGTSLTYKEKTYPHLKAPLCLQVFRINCALTSTSFEDERIVVTDVVFEISSSRNSMPVAVVKR